MLASLNSAAAKKDLHVGGVGAEPANTLASVIDPLMEASENWVRKARDFATGADEYVRANPWAAIGAIAMVGVTLGYFLSRRGPRRHSSETWTDE